jgi:hypothetical protein
MRIEKVNPITQKMLDKKAEEKKKLIEKSKKTNKDGKTFDELFKERLNSSVTTSAVGDYVIPAKMGKVVKRPLKKDKLFSFKDIVEKSSKALK